MKNIWKLTLLAVAAFCLASCSDDNEGKSGDNKKPENIKGVYILSEGNSYKGINGDLTVYDPETKTCTNGIFKTVNQRALLGTSNDGIVYGSRLYIANNDENIVEVVDAKTARSIKRITLNGARCIKADNGYIYVTSFTENKVTKIDTVNYSVAGTIATDAYPEGMAVMNGILYVANSGYGSGSTVTAINLANFTKLTTITVPTNPVDLTTDGKSLFLLCSGKYNADYSGYDENPAVYTLGTDGKTVKIADATYMAIGPNKLYLVDNNFYSTSGVTYSVYDLNKKSVSTWTPSELPFSPYTIAVNPANGDVYITSYVSKDYGNGNIYPDYEGNGRVMRYDSNGTKLDMFVCGVNPGTVIFF